MEENIIREPEKFSHELLELLKKKISRKEQLKIDFKKIVRCNDQVYHGIIISKEDSDIAKNFYVEQIFQKHQSGESLDDLVDEVILMAENDNLNPAVDGRVIMEKMADYDFMTDGHLMVRLLSMERNREYLSGKLYVPFNSELALAVYAVVDKDAENGLESTCITEEIFKHWQVSKEQVITDILMQMENLFPVKCVRMAEMVMEMLGEDSFAKMMNPPELEENEKPAVFQTYILTNDCGVNGSATIAYPGVLEAFAKKHGVEEVSILPSSQHEVLLIPQNQYAPARKKLVEMVREVNRTVVMDADILSDNLFIYDAKTDKVHIWDSKE